MPDLDSKELLQKIDKLLEAKLEEKEKSKEKPPYWTVERIERLLILVASLVGVTFGIRGNHKIDTVEAGQVAAVAVAEDVKDKLDKTTEKQERQLNKLERSTEAVEDSQGPILWRTWKNLEDDADYARTNGLTAEAKSYSEKAAEAKAKFEAHMKRQRNGKN